MIRIIVRRYPSYTTQNRGLYKLIEYMFQQYWFVVFLFFFICHVCVLKNTILHMVRDGYNNISPWLIHGRSNLMPLHR